MAGGLDQRAGRPATPATSAPRSRPSTPSTARCRASWRPSWRWRWPASTAARATSPRGSTGPARAPTRTTSPRPRSAWPGSAPPVRDVAGAVAGARSGAVHQPELHRGAAAAGGPALRVGPGAGRRWPRRWTACRAYASTRASRRELTAAILERALAGVEQQGPKTGREDRAVPGPTDDSLRRRAGSHLPTAGRHRERRSTRATRLVDKANAVRRWTLTMTQPLERPPTRHGADPRCPNCGAEVTAGGRFCEACGTPLTPIAAPADDRPDELESPIELTQSLHAEDRPGGRGHHPDRQALHQLWRRGRGGRLLRDLRHQGTRANATTTPSSPHRGSPPAATRASGTTATRTRPPWRPVRHRVAGRAGGLRRGVHVARLRRRQPGRRPPGPGRARRQQAGRHRHSGQPGAAPSPLRWRTPPRRPMPRSSPTPRPTVRTPPPAPSPPPCSKAT